MNNYKQYHYLHMKALFGHLHQVFVDINESDQFMVSVSLKYHKPFHQLYIISVSLVHVDKLFILFTDK